VAQFKDKTVQFGVGYADSNINVFVFGALPFNDVFGYPGISSFNDIDVDSSLQLTDTQKSVASGALLDQEGNWLLDQTENYYVGYYEGALTTKKTVSSSLSFTDKEVTTAATNFTNETVDG